LSSAVDLELARISQRIRSSREQAGLTLQELARKSGVATSTIQKVETEQMIPSVAVILKIAKGLGKGAADLVRDGDDETEAVHLRAVDRHPIGTPGRLLVERLTGDLFDPVLETWRVTLHPGASSGRSPIRYDGEELVICEGGSVVVRLGEDEHALATGDSLHFKASIPHGWRNDGDSAAAFTITGTLPRKLRTALRRRAASG
jgi:transcriptional regulator with XRE-family HTH domain